MTGLRYQTLDDTSDKPTKDPLQCSWVAAEHPAVSTKVVNRRGIQTGCVLLIVVIVLVIGFAAGLAVGHFLWKPLPAGQKCGQTAESMNSNQAEIQVEVVEFTGSGEDELISPDIGSDNSEFDLEDVLGSGEMGSGEEAMTGVVTVFTKDVEYYDETRLNMEGRNTVLVNVKTCHNAYIGLMTESRVTNRDMIEVVIGGTDDRNLVAIRSCHECYLPNKADVEFAPEEISPLTVCHQYRRFWIYWDDECVMVGRDLDICRKLRILGKDRYLQVVSQDCLR